MDTNSGTLVLYSLTMQSVGASAHGASSAAASEAADSDNRVVGPTAPILVLDPPPGGNGGSAVIGPGPVARSSERTIAGADTVKPPIIVISPTAPKKPGPVAHESETIAGDRTVRPGPIVIKPTAPKKPGPVAHELESANV